MPVQLTTALRVVGTSLFALAVLGGILAAYVTGYQFIHTEKHYLSFGLYGAILGLHLLIQSLFAFLEHRRMRRAGRTLKLPSPLQRSVALCIAAYQEDPDYLRKCLRSAQRIAFPDLKVVLVVDGNRQEDAYMLDIFHEVLGGTEQAGFFVWRSNFHEAGEGETEASLQEGMDRVRDVVRASTFSCIMQKWGGKREVMYTAFKALGDSVDYVQVRGRRPRRVCDPNTPSHFPRILHSIGVNLSASFVHSSIQWRDSFLPATIHTPFIHLTIREIVHSFCSFIYPFSEEISFFFPSFFIHSSI